MRSIRPHMLVIACMLLRPQVYTTSHACHCMHMLRTSAGIYDLTCLLPHACSYVHICSLLQAIIDEESTDNFRRYLRTSSDGGNQPLVILVLEKKWYRYTKTTRLQSRQRVQLLFHEAAHATITHILFDLSGRNFKKN